jgi:hypothetical protein
MPVMTNMIGKRGEILFSFLISQPGERGVYCLDPSFLGDKYPTIDFIVDLLNYPGKRSFFFASVKATQRGMDGEQRLRVQVSKQDLGRLQSFGVPVYLFGVDETGEQVYFLCANNLDATQDLRGMPTRHLLTAASVEKLWQEVGEFWDKCENIRSFFSKFG